MHVSKEYTIKSFRSPIDLNIDYESELNVQQLAAVTATPGPALVLAGAVAVTCGLWNAMIVAVGLAAARENLV